MAQIGRIVINYPNPIPSVSAAALSWAGGGLTDDLAAARRDVWYTALALQVGLNRNAALFERITGFDVHNSTSIYDSQPIIMFDFYERDGFGPNHRIVITRDQAAEWADRPNYVRLAAAYVIRELEKLIKATASAFR